MSVIHCDSFIEITKCLLSTKSHNINDDYKFSISLEVAIVSVKCRSLNCKFVPNSDGCKTVKSGAKSIP